MFLKTESFEYNGVSVTLSELSALQRIEHLALLKRQAEQAGSSLNRQVSVEDLVRTGAFLVAMSLWYSHPQKTKMPSMNEAVKQIEQEVLTTWPTEAIAQAENVVMRLQQPKARVLQLVLQARRLLLPLHQPTVKKQQKPVKPMQRQARLQRRTRRKHRQQARQQLKQVKTQPESMQVRQQSRINMSYSHCLMCGYRLTIHWI
ncbi:phage minor tail protein G [Escherichia coli O5]|nr:phage minor tail protein G [Escherichia coli O5]